jgi:hypothetical protein
VYGKYWLAGVGTGVGAGEGMLVGILVGVSTEVGLAKGVGVSVDAGGVVVGGGVVGTRSRKATSTSAIPLHGTATSTSLGVVLIDGSRSVWITV